MVSAEKLAIILTHLRNDHSGVQLPPEEEHRLKIGRCRHCHCYFKGVQAHQKKCKKRLGGDRRAPAGGPPAAGAPGPRVLPHHRPALPRSVSLPGAPIDLRWTFGPPGGRSGHSVHMSWAFVPMIRCALGMLEAGGLARFLAGDARWDRWRDAYAADFVGRDVSASSLSFDETGYIGEEEQLRLLRGAPGGGESNVPDLVEGEFTQWALQTLRLEAARRPPLSPSTPPDSSGLPGAGSAAPLPRLPRVAAPLPAVHPDGARLSVAELVEHPRLWSYMLPGCEEHWLAAARPRMQALLEAQLGAETPDVRARGLAIDAILSLPAHSLVRVRGGVRRVQGAMRTRLRTVASAARTGDALPPAPVFCETEPRDRSDQARWASQLAHAKELGERGNLRRCVATLTQSGVAEWSHDRVEHMRKLHPAGPIALPHCPEDAPYNIFDKDNVSKLVKRLLHSTAAGPSGWTAELLAPLLGDAVVWTSRCWCSSSPTMTWMSTAASCSHAPSCKAPPSPTVTTFDRWRWVTCLSRSPRRCATRWMRGFSRHLRAAAARCVLPWRLRARTADRAGCGGG